MHRHNRRPTVRRAQEVVPGTGPDDREAGPFEGSDDLLPSRPGASSWDDRHLLDADKIERLGIIPFNFKVERDRLLDTLDELIEGRRLGVTAGGRGHRAD